MNITILNYRGRGRGEEEERRRMATPAEEAEQAICVRIESLS
jgi:hypothetical protein